MTRRSTPRHGLVLGAVLLGTGIVVGGMAGAATATAATAPPDGPSAGCDLGSGFCQPSVVVPGTGKKTEPGHDGRPETSGTDSGQDKSSSGDDSGTDDADDTDQVCTTMVASPQPAKSDPVWAGHTDGVILAQVCNTGLHINEGTVGISTTTFWSQNGDPQTVPTVTPAQLAYRALALLHVPKPVVHRSPSEANTDNGRPYTWINIPTWYWTDTRWTPLAKTARVGAVWATVTVTPAQLVVAAGDGRTEHCDGPGRAWQNADGTTAPRDACTHTYTKVADAVTAAVSIRWTVSWHGSSGTGADLPDMTTTTTGDPTQVEQIETVIRR